MPSAFLTFGIILFVLGLVSYFFSHSVILSGIICALGYVFWVLGVIGRSVETSGEVNFS